jgi:hypothetical protein
VLALRLSCVVAVAALGCGSTQRPLDPAAVAAGGPSSRIEQRSLSERPPLSIIEREGDPECAVGFASLAGGSAELHAAVGELLRQRLARAGLAAQLVTHGLGFELTLLGENSRQARVPAQALLQALAQPVTAAELPAAVPRRAEEAQTSAVDRCSAELGARRPFSDAAELDRERVATLARDRSAFAVVGNEEAASAVADALAAGPDWPELGVVRQTLPESSVTQVVRGERSMLSVALTVADPNRALAAARRLGDAKSALGLRLATLGAGLRVRRVTATAHPQGACLRVDSEVDASPLPDALRLGYAAHFIEEEANLALAHESERNELEATAVSAADPRLAARAAAYRTLVAAHTSLSTARLVALATPDEAPLVPAIEAAIEQARAAVVPLEAQVRSERGQPGSWALVTFPCAAASERAGTAGHASVLLAAASQNRELRVRLEPWLGGSGVGLLGFTERAPGETEAETSARLGEALGRALVSPPPAIDIATARAALIQSLGETPHPLLEALLESLAPGHVGALAPQGSATSLQAASREAVLSRQRELLRQAPRVAVLTPGSSGDAAFVSRSLARWLESPDAPRAAPCSTDVGPAARSELSMVANADAPEGSYVAFRISPKASLEASVLAELLNLPGGALARAMAEPELVGAARALVFGTSSARALIVQVSALEGRELEAVSRVQKLFERLAAGGVLTAADLESALGKRRHAQRLAVLDPRQRLLQLLEPVPAPPDAAALRRFVALLRPEAAIIARSTARLPTSSAGKSPASR